MKYLIARTKFIHVLSLVVVLGTFAFFFAYCFSPLSDEQRNASKEIVIALITAQGMILSYHAGSTAGSQQKTDTLMQMQQSSRPGTQITVDNAQNVNAGTQPAQTSTETENEGVS